MTTTTKTKTTTKVKKAPKVIILSVYKDKSKEELVKLGEAYKQQFPIAKDAEILTELPKPADVKGCIIVGNLLPTYLIAAAEIALEANASAYWKLPTKIQAMLEVDDVLDMLSFPKALKVKELDVTSYLPQEEQM